MRCSIPCNVSYREWEGIGDRLVTKDVKNAPTCGVSGENIGVELRRYERDSAILSEYTSLEHIKIRRSPRTSPSQGTRVALPQQSGECSKNIVKRRLS